MHARIQTFSYTRNKQFVCSCLNGYAARIDREESTRHKQTIQAKLTGIYAVERNHRCKPVKVLFWNGSCVEFSRCSTHSGTSETPSAFQAGWKHEQGASNSDSTWRTSSVHPLCVQRKKAQV